MKACMDEPGELLGRLAPCASPVLFVFRFAFAFVCAFRVVAGRSRVGAVDVGTKRSCNRWRLSRICLLRARGVMWCGLPVHGDRTAVPPDRGSQSYLQLFRSSPRRCTRSVFSIPFVLSSPASRSFPIPVRAVFVRIITWAGGRWESCKRNGGGAS